MSSRDVLRLVGSALMVVGLVLGFLGIERSGVDCGSAFSSSGILEPSTTRDLLGITERQVADCEDALASRKTIAVVMLAGGAVLTIGSQFVGQPKD